MKPKPIRGYDDQLSRKLITHVIYPGIVIQDHRELTAPLLITELRQHPLILDKTWLNTHGVVIDMKEDRLRFLPGRYQHDVPLKMTSERLREPELIPEIVRPRITSILKRPPKKQPPNEEEDILYLKTPAKRTPKIGTENGIKEIKIAIIGAAAYQRLAQDPTIKTFSITPCQIDRILESINLCQISEMQTPEEVKDKLPLEYYDFLDVFDRKKAEILPPHRPYDYKIEIEGEVGKLPKSRLYPMSEFKLRKVKEYLIDNLKKGFITPSKAPYASSILFTAKKDGSLRFCVDYRKLNVLTKRDRYPISLIDEILARV